MYACQHGSVESVKLYLNHGAKLDVKDTGGRTAYAYAKLSGNQAIMDLFPRESEDASSAQPRKPSLSSEQVRCSLINLPCIAYIEFQGVFAPNVDAAVVAPIIGAWTH